MMEHNPPRHFPHLRGAEFGYSCGGAGETKRGE
jgi:hypothetical protein